jgi:uncharacterized protein (DUF1015 family)
MAVVRPFPGLRFWGVPLAEVIAPPFDVISPEQQAALYARSPYNVVRLELGREANPYAEARASFQAWRASGVLRQDEPSLYLYEQRFRAPGSSQQYVRRGLIARVKLEPWEAGVVLPHELTHRKAKEDRIQLLRAVNANVSPVFGLYEDPDGVLAETLAAAARQPPLAEAVDDAGEEHRLWTLADGQVERFFESKLLFIADGHHRYETALAYRDERRAVSQSASSRDAAPYDYVMMALVDFADPGLLVLPTHRLIYDLSDDGLRQLASGLGEYFDVAAVAESASPKALEGMLAQLAAARHPSFVLYGPLPSGLRLLTLKPEWHGHTFDASHSPAWNALEVSIIHAIIGRVLKLSAEDVSGQRYFRYIQEPPTAIRAVQCGEAQLALLLRSTPATAIRDVALAQDKMPQKSTYLYPKLATGVVINPLD